jgi:hypothetical protein
MRSEVGAVHHALLRCRLRRNASCVLPSSTATKGDQPFEKAVYYGKKYKEYGAVPGMLNFGSAG